MDTKPDVKSIQKAAIEIARLVQHLMIDPRSLAALDMAEQYIEGNATKKQMLEADAAAFAAAAAYAYAADAAAYAADAADAAAAAADARTNIRLYVADIVRKHIKPIF